MLPGAEARKGGALIAKHADVELLLFRTEDAVKKAFLAVALLLAVVAGAGATGRVRVRSHTTKSGTYVRSHVRTSPDRSFRNNWSTKGNTNPVTGKRGTKTH